VRVPVCAQKEMFRRIEEETTMDRGGEKKKGMNLQAEGGDADKTRAGKRLEGKMGEAYKLAMKKRKHRKTAPKSS